MNSSAPRAIDTDAPLRELFTACFDGTLSQQERDELNQRLTNDPAARSLYLDFCSVHTALSYEHGVVLSPDAATNADNVAPPIRTRSPRAVSKSGTWRSLSSALSAISALAACLLLLIFGFVWSNTTTTGPVVARITNRAHVELLQQQHAWTADVLTADTYELRTGLLSFTYDNGVTVLVESPARFTLSNNNSLTLTMGRLSSQVPPTGVGFTIHTPEAEVIDLGTEFGVDVTPDGNSEVHVFKGLVNVRSTMSPPGQHMLLATEQAARVADPSLQPAGITMDKERFFRSFDEPISNYPKFIRSLAPVSYYRFAVTDDGSLRDTVGQTPGQILLGPGSRIPSSTGVLGNALRVAGKSMGRGAYFSQPPVLANGTCTFIAWVRADARADGGIIFLHQAMNTSLQLGFDSANGHLQATIRDHLGTQQRCRDTQPLTLNVWHHVAVVVDGTQLLLYRDGKQVAAISSPGLDRQATTAWWLGTNFNGADVWDGLIDECVIFSRPLLAEEINELAIMPEK